MAIPTHILSPLVDALAELYPEPADARAMIRFAGLDESQIEFSGKADTTWSSVVREAELQGRTPDLLARAQAQYPNYAPLTAAGQAYTSWAATGRPGPSPVRPSSGGRRIPLWVWLAAGAARVVRGGSFFLNEWYVRCAARGNSGPLNRLVSSAFRVVVSPSHP
jgi:hypothetical protein